MRQTSTVVFCAVDALVPIRGQIQDGFDEFCLALEHANVPMVWVTDRSRAQMDEPLRKLGHRHPFIGEAGCGVYLPEGYFHLRAEGTVRMGRFTCIPIAEPQPAGAQALETVAGESSVEVVALKSLSSRELSQNLGLPAREAEAARQRDFDELFFFAGTSEDDVSRFREVARQRKLSLQRHGVLWSLSVGGNVGRAVRELLKLYERALRFRPNAAGIATIERSEMLFPVCDRRVLLRKKSPGGETDGTKEKENAKIREHFLSSPDVWDSVLAEIAVK